MAKKKEEEAPKGSPAWMATFSDLMNLLLCFFVLLFSMSSVDESKAEAMIKSLADTFSIFSGGGSSFEDGVLISSGATQLSNLDEYFNTTGRTDEGDSIENVDQNKNGAEGDGKNDNNGENQQNQQDPQNQTGENNENPENGKTPDDQTGNKTPDDQNGPDDNQGKQENGEDKQNENTEEGKVKELTEAEIAEKAAANDLAENKEQSGILYEEIMGLADKYNIGDYMDIAIDAQSYEYVQIEINGSVLFDSGKAEIKDEALPIISKLGDVLKQYREYKIEVIGHTDNVPNTKKSDYPTNELLSSARAISVASYFAETKGIGWSKIYFSGRGEHEPVASNDTAEGRALNRRVEIRLYNLKNSD